MSKRITTDTRDELLESLVTRYEAADRDKKGRILDEFVQLTGHHRKHATRVLNRWQPKTNNPKRGRRVYDDAVRAVLLVLWEASDRVCGRRLRAAIPELLTAMEHHGHIDLADDIREQLLGMSAATIDRALIPARAGRKKLGHRKRVSSAASVKASVPVRTFADWSDPPPGFFEIDFVVHGGGSAAGRFIHSLVLTDIASGWTEAVPLLA
ncbi:Mobile element protein [Enhygromyxa salina]|uniref:Mobile element protein n=1 Tax=Enhygromyxa salina TaxID=215803 RepID=A0A0C2A0B9_9BACT|nr:hypothetical protein [Enhygromyxa salina]KIG16813.1 Mobile element protein [Enhygromyxa salina]